MVLTAADAGGLTYYDHVSYYFKPIDMTNAQTMKLDVKASTANLDLRIDLVYYEETKDI